MFLKKVTVNEGKVIPTTDRQMAPGWGVGDWETCCISQLMLGDLKRHHFTLSEKERKMINTSFVFGKTVRLKNIVHTFKNYKKAKAQIHVVKDNYKTL